MKGVQRKSSLAVVVQRTFKKELEDKIRRTADETSAQKAVDRMEELGLLDDERFARHYAEKLLNSKHMSKRGIAFELTRKGIDKETAEQLCDELDIDVHEQIRAVIEKNIGIYPMKR